MFKVETKLRCNGKIWKTTKHCIQKYKKYKRVEYCIKNIKAKIYNLKKNIDC